MTNNRFERSLRSVLEEMAPASVPASLRDAVAVVPRSHPVPASQTNRSAPQRLAMFAPLAAVIVLGVVLVVLVGGSLGGKVAAPSPTAAAIASWTTLTYEAAMPARTTSPTAASIGASLAVAEARLRSLGIPFAAQAAAAKFSVTVPSDQAMRVQDVIGATGDVAFVPLGSESAAAGTTIDMVAHPPLFGSEGIASVSAGVDASGLATVDITLTPSATTAFAAHTAAHIGEFFAIVLDGKVVTAPVIQEAIPNGQVQIVGGGSGGFDPARQSQLIAILASGPYPQPLVELGTAPATAPPDFWTPSPSKISTTPSAAAEATSAPQSSASPSREALPSFTVATNLSVEPLAGAPAGIRQVVNWSGGYAAVAANPSASEFGSTLWSSRDGLTWSPMAGGPADAKGASPRALLLAPCRTGLLVLGSDFSGTADVTSDYSTDGLTWSTSGLPASLLAPDQVTGLAGGAAGAVATSGDGRAIGATDCTSWHKLELPGTGPLVARGVGIAGSRLVITGYSGDPATNAHVRAMAWWSDSLASWHPVLPKTAADQGFGTVVAGGGPLLVAEMTSPGYTPGQRSWWATADGASWHELSAPLGVYDDGAGAGSVAGWITGSGGRLFDWGVPRSTHAGTPEFWATVDGTTWTQLAVAGSGAAAILNSDSVYHPLQVAGAILFATPNGPTMIGTGPAASVGP